MCLCDFFFWHQTEVFQEVGLYMHKQPRPLKKKKERKRKLINICGVHAPILSNALTSENTHGDLEVERSVFCRDLQRGESGAQRNLTDWPQWLCYTTDALHINSVSTHAMFHLSEQFRIASDKMVIRLLTSSSRLVCCILESRAALICCCSKHLGPPGSQTSATICTQLDSMCCHYVKMNRGASWRWMSHRQGAERWGDLMAPWVLGSEFIAIYMRRCLCRMSFQSSKVSVIKLESGSRCFKDPSDVDKADYQTRIFVGWTNTETNDDVFAHPSYLHYISEACLCFSAFLPFHKLCEKPWSQESTFPNSSNFWFES